MPAGKIFKPPKDFDLRGFLKDLVSPHHLNEIRYYLGSVKRIRGDAKSEDLYAKQQQVIAFLQNQKVALGYGHIIRHPDGSHHEKGVDVLLAVEMIRLASEDAYDVAYLVSSDTDLVPAVEECQRLGKKVVYVGSSLHGKSFGLTKISDQTVLLQKKDVLPFVPPKLFP